MAESDEFSADDRSAFGALLGKSFAMAGGSLTDLLGRQVTVGSPSLAPASAADVTRAFPSAVVASKVKFAEGVSGMNWMILKEKDASVIADLMMGNDGSAPPDELSDIQLAAVDEVLDDLRDDPRLKHGPSGRMDAKIIRAANSQQVA